MVANNIKSILSEYFMFHFTSVVQQLCCILFGFEYPNKDIKYPSGLDLLIYFKQFKNKELIEIWKKKLKFLLLNLMIINPMISDIASCQNL